MSSDFSTISSNSTFTSDSVLSGTGFATISISLNGTVTSGAVQHYLANTPSIYEVLSNSNSDFINYAYKTNFASTGPQTILVSLEDILLPPQFFCATYSTYTTLLFYGGVIRFSTEIMMFGLVTKTSDTLPFGSWQAVSFSHSHAFRDMIGVVHNTGTLYDMFSLIADTPYDDTSTNIDGLNDLVLIDSSGLITQARLNTFY